MQQRSELARGRGCQVLRFGTTSRVPDARRLVHLGDGNGSKDLYLTQVWVTFPITMPQIARALQELVL